MAGALDNGLDLRLPGQWDDGTWSDATSSAGIYYNVYRWYQSGTSRYTRPDPAGRLGEPHPYLYARANPVLLADFLGLKSRVCCTPIVQTIGLNAFKHCFLEIEDDQGKKETHALHGMGTPRRSWGGPIGCTFPNDPFDRGAPDQPGYDCGPWNEDCESDECVRREAGNYPRASRHKLRGPNSNTFAGNIARSCNLEAPPPWAGRRPAGVTRRRRASSSRRSMGACDRSPVLNGGRGESMYCRSIQTLTVAGFLQLVITAASCGSYELWPKTEEFLGRIECDMSEEEVAAIAADYPGLEFKDSKRGTPWDKVAYKPQTSIALDFEEGRLRRAEVSWVDAILHAKVLPVRDFCGGKDP